MSKYRQMGETPGFNPLPQLVFLEDAWKAMRYLVSACPTEINGFGMVERVGSELQVTHVFSLDQDASGEHAQVTPKAQLACQNYMMQNGLDGNKMRLQWHSHMGSAFFSGKDLAVVESHGRYTDWAVSVVLNRYDPRDYAARLDLYRPFRIYTPIPLIVEQAYDRQLEAWAQAQVAAHVTFTKPGIRRRQVAVQPQSVDPVQISADDLVVGDDDS